MAVRVRKIARELDRSPEDLLLLLKDLGYARFRSEDDMVSDLVAEQLRKAARSRPPRAVIAPSRRPLPPGSRPPAPPGASIESADHEDGDLMARLVPGVVRSGQEPRPKARSKSASSSSASTRAPARPRESPSDSAPSPKGSPKSATSRLDPVAPLDRHGDLEADKERLRAEWAQLHAERERLAAEAQLLAARGLELDARASELDNRAAELDARAAAIDVREMVRSRELEERSSSVLALMEERGLRGQDEAERAMLALAQGHALGRFLGTLMPSEPAAFARLLAERLVLVGGPVPDGLGVPAVTVSPERADLPGGDRLARTFGRIGELLLLNGMRRVLLVAVPPRWHGVLRDGVDKRVELLFRPVARDGEELGRIDQVVGWNVEVEVLRDKALSINAPTMGEFLERWCSALASTSGDGS